MKIDYEMRFKLASQPYFENLKTQNPTTYFRFWESKAEKFYPNKIKVLT